MADSDLLTPFDNDVIRAVAATEDVDEARLRSALADHQRTMRDNPGVENLVYEWRKRYDGAVLHRTPETYYVAVHASVWEEFGDHLGLDGYLLSAVVAVHQEQLLRTDGVAADELDTESVAVVVGRPT